MKTKPKTKFEKKMLEEFWSAVDKDGISRSDRFREPLLVHIKDLMPDSEIEDIEDEMKDFINNFLLSTIRKASEEAYKRAAGDISEQCEHHMKMARGYEREMILEKVRKMKRKCDKHGESFKEKGECPFCDSARLVNEPYDEVIKAIEEEV